MHNLKTLEGEKNNYGEYNTYFKFITLHCLQIFQTIGTTENNQEIDE